MRLAVLGLAIALTTVAHAEVPERVGPQETISIAMGRTQTLKFQSQFDTINVTSKGVVEATANSDHMVTLTGLAEGETIMTISKGGREIYSATVTITTEPGHVVRHYGGNSPDYVGSYCSATFCGRSNKDLNGSREPSSETTTTANSNGSESKTKTFGR